MTATPQPDFHAANQHILATLVHALGDHPGDTQAQREARARALLASVAAFQPRDPVETMLAGLIVTHFHLAQYAARDAALGATERDRARARSGHAALERLTATLLRELRTARKRPLESDARPAPPQSQARPRPQAPEPPKPPAPKAETARKAETAKPASAIALPAPPDVSSPFPMPSPGGTAASVAAMLAASSPITVRLSVPARPAPGPLPSARDRVPAGAHASGGISGSTSA